MNEQGRGVQRRPGKGDEVHTHTNLSCSRGGEASEVTVGEDGAVARGNHHHLIASLTQVAVDVALLTER